MKLKNHLYAILPLTYGTVVMLITAYFKEIEITSPFLWGIYAFLFVPCLFLHIDYIINDWNVSLDINEQRQSIYYQKGNDKTNMHFSDIKYLHFFGETKGFNILPMYEYWFCVIHTHGNRYFIISSLVSRNLHKIIPNDKVVKHRRLFASIMLEDEIKIKN